MNKHLLTLLIICLGIFLPQVVLGDTVPTEGTWGKERYRSIIPNPPTVSIDGNLLSIHFIDALDDLTVQVLSLIHISEPTRSRGIAFEVI